MDSLYFLHIGIIAYIVMMFISYFIWRVWPNDMRGDEDALACNLLWSFVWPLGWFIGLIIFLSYWGVKAGKKIFQRVKKLLL